MNAPTIVTDYTAPAEIASWLACFFFLVALAGAIKYLLPSKKEKTPQPLQVQYAERLATFEELQNLQSDFDEFKVQQRAANHEMQQSAEEGRRRLHERIEEIPQKVINLLQSTKGLMQ